MLTQNEVSGIVKTRSDELFHYNLLILSRLSGI